MERLEGAGFSSGRIRVIPILVGVSGTIYATHTLSALEDLGVSKENAKACARNLHFLMVEQLHAIVCVRRRLENASRTLHDPG